MMQHALPLSPVDIDRPVLTVESYSLFAHTYISHTHSLNLNTLVTTPGEDEGKVEENLPRIVTHPLPQQIGTQLLTCSVPLGGFQPETGHSPPPAERGKHICSQQPQ
jgi:hypothetical protein